MAKAVFLVFINLKKNGKVYGLETTTCTKIKNHIEISKRTWLANIMELCERAAYYADAHLIWYYFLVIGLIAGAALFIFKYVTEKADSWKEAV